MFDVITLAYKKSDDSVVSSSVESVFLNAIAEALRMRANAPLRPLAKRLSRFTPDAIWAAARRLGDCGGRMHNRYAKFILAQVITHIWEYERLPDTTIPKPSPSNN